jgi:Xaa-Pro aminopeptidase
MVEEKISRMVKPGVEGKDLHRKALELFKRNGFETGKKNGFPYGFFHGIGHGLGIEIHEKPSLSGGDKLEEGDVITIEPGLYYPGIGGVRHENVYYVTATGATLLTDYEIPFEIP